MKDFVRDELLRVVHTLPETDPRTSEYHILLRSIEILDSVGSTIDDIIALEPCNEDCTDCAECDEKVDDSKVVNFPFTPPEPHEAEAEPEPQMTSSEVRTKLAAARRAGVNVASIIKDMGVDNFTALPAGRYGELLKRIDDAGSGMD